MPAGLCGSPRPLGVYEGGARLILGVPFQRDSVECKAAKALSCGHGVLAAADLVRAVREAAERPLVACALRGREPRLMLLSLRELLESGLKTFRSLLLRILGFREVRRFTW